MIIRYGVSWNYYTYSKTGKTRYKKTKAEYGELDTKEVSFSDTTKILELIRGQFDHSVFVMGWCPKEEEKQWNY